MVFPALSSEGDDSKVTHSLEIMTILETLLWINTDEAQTYMSIKIQQFN